MVGKSDYQAEKEARERKNTWGQVPETGNKKKKSKMKVC